MSTHDSRPSPFIRALRGASPALWPTRLRLMGLKSAYKTNAYSGHPEDMLDSIDGQEAKIRQYKNGQRPAVPPLVETAADVEPVPAPFERSDSAVGRREFEELTARSSLSGGPFEEGLEAAQRRLSHMEYLYRTGGYMGHPEEMLEDIEDEQRRVDRLKAEAAVS